MTNRFLTITKAIVTFCLILFSFFTANHLQLQFTQKTYNSLSNSINIQKTQFTNNLINQLAIPKPSTKYNQHCSYIPLPDTRIIAMHRFLQHYKSPMTDYANIIVQTADKYNQDWRIIISIAGVESAFGRITRPNSYNAWGWRGGPDGDFSNFQNWEQAIIYITKKFTNGYGQNPNPYDFYKTYCPTCTLAWPNGVTNYMHQLDSYRQQVNKELQKKYSQ